MYPPLDAPTSQLWLLETEHLAARARATAWLKLYCIRSSVSFLITQTGDQGTAESQASKQNTEESHERQSPEIRADGSPGRCGRGWWWPSPWMPSPPLPAGYSLRRGPGRARRVAGRPAAGAAARSELDIFQVPKNKSINSYVCKFCKECIWPDVPCVYREDLGASATDN